ncbi:hypothetical protein [Urbifossiella limnaea]|uniref:Uncharacterized protein n=1 Tax=Urbifossiella limnaea TaxID=2528023 RepID=A0A517XST8_9BACT|nr:hypothetical protein [Urbifossiella limnaea]QDU20586.1 hypothetical protein ETAA1_25410 [Urbifossiella limnaea]
MRVVKPVTLKRNTARLLAVARRLAAGAISQNKAEFHAVGRAVLRAVLGHLGVEGDVRSCKGGPAVAGEVILHTEAVYVCLTVPYGGGLQFYYRTVKGRTDYCGGTNNWFTFERLAGDPLAFVESLRGLCPHLQQESSHVDGR